MNTRNPKKHPKNKNEKATKRTKTIRKNQNSPKIANVGITPVLPEPPGTDSKGDSQSPEILSNLEKRGFERQKANEPQLVPDPHQAVGRGSTRQKYYGNVPSSTKKGFYKMEYNTREYNVTKPEYPKPTPLHLNKYLSEMSPPSNLRYNFSYPNRELEPNPSLMPFVFPSQQIMFEEFGTFHPNLGQNVYMNYLDSHPAYEKEKELVRFRLKLLRFHKVVNEINEVVAKMRFPVTSVFRVRLGYRLREFELNYLANVDRMHKYLVFLFLFNVYKETPTFYNESDNLKENPVWEFGRFRSLVNEEADLAIVSSKILLFKDIFYKYPKTGKEVKHLVMRWDSEAVTYLFNEGGEGVQESGFLVLVRMINVKILVENLEFVSKLDKIYENIEENLIRLLGYYTLVCSDDNYITIISNLIPKLSEGQLNMFYHQLGLLLDVNRCNLQLCYLERFIDRILPICLSQENRSWKFVVNNIINVIDPIKLNKTTDKLNKKYVNCYISLIRTLKSFSNTFVKCTKTSYNIFLICIKYLVSSLDDAKVLIKSESSELMIQIFLHNYDSEDWAAEEGASGPGAALRGNIVNFMNYDVIKLLGVLSGVQSIKLNIWSYLLSSSDSTEKGTEQSSQGAKVFNVLSALYAKAPNQNHCNIFRVGSRLEGGNKFRRRTAESLMNADLGMLNLTSVSEFAFLFNLLSYLEKVNFVQPKARSKLSPSSHAQLTSLKSLALGYYLGRFLRISKDSLQYEKLSIVVRMVYLLYKYFLLIKFDCFNNVNNTNNDFSDCNNFKDSNFNHDDILNDTSSNNDNLNNLKGFNNFNNNNNNSYNNNYNNNNYSNSNSNNNNIANTSESFVPTVNANGDLANTFGNTSYLNPKEVGMVNSDLSRNSESVNLTKALYYFINNAHTSNLNQVIEYVLAVVSSRLDDSNCCLELANIKLSIVLDLLFFNYKDNFEILATTNLITNDPFTTFLSEGGNTRLVLGSIFENYLSKLSTIPLKELSLELESGHCPDSLLENRVNFMDYTGGVDPFVEALMRALMNVSTLVHFSNTNVTMLKGLLDYLANAIVHYSSDLSSVLCLNSIAAVAATNLVHVHYYVNLTKGFEHYEELVRSERNVLRELQSLVTKTYLYKLLVIYKVNVANLDLRVNSVEVPDLSNSRFQKGTSEKGDFGIGSRVYRKLTLVESWEGDLVKFVLLQSYVLVLEYLYNLCFFPDLRTHGVELANDRTLGELERNLVDYVSGYGSSDDDNLETLVSYLSGVGMEGEGQVEGKVYSLPNYFLNYSHDQSTGVEADKCTFIYINRREYSDPDSDSDSKNHGALIDLIANLLTGGYCYLPEARLRVLRLSVLACLRNEMVLYEFVYYAATLAFLTFYNNNIRNLVKNNELTEARPAYRRKLELVLGLFEELLVSLSKFRKRSVLSVFSSVILKVTNGEVGTDFNEFVVRSELSGMNSYNNFVLILKIIVSNRLLWGHFGRFPVILSSLVKLMPINELLKFLGQFNIFEPNPSDPVAFENSNLLSVVNDVNYLLIVLTKLLYRNTNSNCADNGYVDGGNSMSNANEDHQYLTVNEDTSTLNIGNNNSNNISTNDNVNSNNYNYNNNYNNNLNNNNNNYNNNSNNNFNNNNINNYNENSKRNNKTSENNWFRYFFLYVQLLVRILEVRFFCLDERSKSNAGETGQNGEVTKGGETVKNAEILKRRNFYNNFKIKSAVTYEHLREFEYLTKDIVLYLLHDKKITNDNNLVCYLGNTESDSLFVYFMNGYNLARAPELSVELRNAMIGILLFLKRIAALNDLRLTQVLVFSLYPIFVHMTPNEAIFDVVYEVLTEVARMKAKESLDAKEDKVEGSTEGKREEGVAVLDSSQLFVSFLLLHVLLNWFSKFFFTYNFFLSNFRKGRPISAHLIDQYLNKFLNRSSNNIEFEFNRTTVRFPVQYVYQIQTLFQ